MDILLRLNIEEKMTLVMVTHDANLKFYSHRVLKVLDGKIIGEEKIDPKIREDHILKLTKKIKEEKDEAE